MKVSNRQRQILAVLLNSQGDITAGEIAEKIQVSSRTVHRELLDIEAILEASGISLQKKSGIGIQIQADSGQLESFKKQLFAMETSQYSVEERKVLILCMLLESNEPVKLFSLSSFLQVTIPTISSDLDEADQWVRKNSLILIRKRGYGVEIQGAEADKRNAVCRLAADYLDDSELFGKTDDEPVHAVSQRLLSMIGKANFFQIERALWKLEEQYPTTLSETDYTRLLIRLSVAITRCQQEIFIEPDQYPEGHMKDIDDKKFNFFSDSLKLKLPPQEKVYFIRLLECWEQGQSEELLFHNDMVLVELVGKLIGFVEERVSVPLSQDRSLKEGLLFHIDPALKRIREGGVVRNPLLSHIKRDYDALFTIVKQGVNEIVEGTSLPDEEVGFLVMHFGAAIERSKQFSRQIRALLVCTSGIGSSKLLAVRISKELPQIQLTGHVSWFEAARIPEEDYDLIISTVDLPLPSDQYIKLSPLLTNEETEKLRSFIQENTLKRLRLTVPEKAFSSLEIMRSMKQYFDEIVNLVDHFEVYRPQLSDPETDLEGVLRMIQEYLSDRKHITNADTIVSQLGEREKHGSQIIPETELALFHTRSEYVSAPILSLLHLDHPLQMGGEQAKHILLMLGPKEMSKQTVEILSEVSAMLLLPDMIDVLKEEDEAAIKQFISQQFSEFTKIKFEWRD